MSGIALSAVALLCLLSSACRLSTESNPVLLSANVVNPADVDAVSDFHSCAGHAFPEQNSPNSGKNYFWPNSTNFSTTNQLREYAACEGTTIQNSDDTDPNEQDRGNTIHLYCDGGSTALRYFHITMAAGMLGKHVMAGDFLGYASMVGSGQTPSATWQNSSNFDIAVVEGNDDNTEDYFARLSLAAFAAWAVRGVTAVSQTVSPGSPVCSAFSSGIGARDVFSFSPVL